MTRARILFEALFVVFAGLLTVYLLARAAAESAPGELIAPKTGAHALALARVEVER